ncbi:MAG: hypothetical protein WCP97_08370 [bacterium]
MKKRLRSWHYVLLGVTIIFFTGVVFAFDQDFLNEKSEQVNAAPKKVIDDRLLDLQVAESTPVPTSTVAVLATATNIPQPVATKRPVQKPRVVPTTPPSRKSSRPS